jgi:hypothetical protein
MVASILRGSVPRGSSDVKARFEVSWANLVFYDSHFDCHAAAKWGYTVP